MKRSISIVLVFVMMVSLFSIGYASTNEIVNGETEIYSDKVSIPKWVKVAIKVLLKGNEVFFDTVVDHPGEYEYTEYKFHRYSGSISFNRKDIGSFASFNDNKIDESVTSILMHAQRDYPFDFTSKIGIKLEDGDGDTIESKTCGSSQYLIYYPKAGDNFGDWDVDYTTSAKKDWACDILGYYAFEDARYIDGNQNQDMYLANGRVYNVDSLSVEKLNSVDYRNFTQIFNNNTLNASEMYEQLKREYSRNGYVDNYIDFSDGDYIVFEDQIQKIAYDKNDDITCFTFYDSKYDESFSWPFKGDYRNMYKEGDSIALKFRVISVGKANGLDIESLDYIENYFKGTVPYLSQYEV